MARYHPVSNRKGNWLLWVLLAFVVLAGGYFILARNSGQPATDTGGVTVEQPAAEEVAPAPAVLPEPEPEPIVSGGETMPAVAESNMPESSIQVSADKFH